MSRNKGNKKGIRVLFNGFLIVMMLAIAGALLVKNKDRIGLSRFLGEKSESYSFFTDLKDATNKMRSSSENEIKNRAPVYVVDVEKYVAPNPDPAKYDSQLENYSDSTIEMHYHMERLYDSRFHFIEVRIKHPSQLRMALAFDKFGSKRQKPSLMAANVHAVAAVNGCFYNRRYGGIIINKRNVFRNHPYGLDTLLIDSDGNFHIVEDTKVESSGVLQQYDIVNALTFGPELVHDGKALTITKRNWEPSTCEPRTAICQYDDDLHYLICLAEGRNCYSVGVTMQTFADEIATRGVKTAYNLDGGQSGTIVIGNEVKNKIGWGRERAQSDILYFATAIDAADQQ